MADPRLVQPPAARLLAALPDAVTAAIFLSLWIAPLWLGPDGVRNAMLVMLVEFILIHASVFFGSALLGTGSTARRPATLLGFTLFYGLFVAAFAFAFKAWWPFAAFAWLLVGKVTIALDRSRSAPERLRRMQSEQVLATITYLGGVFATTLLPVPQLGIDAEVVAQLGLPGGGLWVDQPHTVIAFGVFYFGLLAWSKWRGWSLPTARPPAAA